LQQTNEQLAQKAQQLAEQNVEVERKNQEIDQARRAVEEKAKELALTSKYKSEFLANMSHELRTPLNSILILGQQLTDNPDGNLTPKQVEFARTIHGAGTDLLNRISDILDLSKIESGTVSVEAEEVFFASLLEMIARPFRHEAEHRRLDFEIATDPALIMMPEMDGYETMQVMRQNPDFRRLPIIALTAKAMKGDREKCLEAGASEYLAKPVNTEQLLSALRMWLHR
jgi:signal transduction histidine kinase